MRVREAATDKRITPLLSTPGDVTPEQGKTAKKGKTLIFLPPPDMVYSVWASVSQGHSKNGAVQRHVFLSLLSNAASYHTRGGNKHCFGSTECMKSLIAL